MKKTLLVLILSVSFIFISCNEYVGGVRVGNNMESYALSYIENHEILSPYEKILAYYDYTISLDGTTAAIITNDRLIFHNQDTKTTYFYLEDITKIKHYKKVMEGFFIEVWKGTELMMINIAPLNDANIFLDVLESNTDL
jgi:hypothetical protein|tara:strand:- start:5624 stop:6043 length:420 start_codon:yes stop_codon:yes gene_type:complete